MVQGARGRETQKKREKEERKKRGGGGGKGEKTVESDRA